jgi:hypothetical protein
MLLHLDYSLDKSALWEIANALRSQATNYVDPRINQTIKNWMVIKHTSPLYRKNNIRLWCRRKSKILLVGIKFKTKHTR